MKKKETKVVVKKVKKIEKVKTIKVDKADKPYHLEVNVNDVEFKINAKDLEIALTEFVASPAFPFGAKTNAVIKYSKGEKEGSKVWRTAMARRMFRIIKIKPNAIKVLAEKLTQELN